MIFLITIVLYIYMHKKKSGDKMLKKIVLFLIVTCLFLGCEQNQTPKPEYEEELTKAKESLVNGDLDGAIKSFDEVVKSDEATPQDKLMWSLLSLANITVDDKMVSIANSFGIENYPTTLNEVVMGSMSGTNNSLIPQIKNVEMFTPDSREVESVVEFDATFLAVLYNIKESYKDGFNPLVDDYVDAFTVLDNVIDELYSISDEDEFVLSYSYFYPDEYSPSRSEWPASYDSENGLQPEDIVLGKAEILPLLSVLEFIRAMQFMSKTLDYSIEVSTYWDIFNPVDGSFYSEVEGNLTIDPNFDYSTIPSPLSQGFLTERDSAKEDLITARDHFVGSIQYIQESLRLISNRTSEDNFFISPANPLIGTADWEYVTAISGYTETFGDMIIDSMVDGDVIYFPTNADVDSLEDINELITNWPTEGSGVNLSKLFEKPLFALDNLLDLNETTYEPNIYIYNNGSMELMSKADYTSNGEFFICFKDYTFNSLIVGADNFIENEILNYEGDLVVIDKSVYIPLTNNQLLVGCSVFPAGETFKWYNVEYKSTGSFYTAPILLANLN